MWRRKVKSVLLVDFDNIVGFVGRPFATNIANWLAWFEDGGFDEKARRREFAVKRVYWNGSTDKYRQPFEALEFDAFACRSEAINKIRANQSSADMMIAMDAMELAHEQRGLGEIILLTADTDFVPLVNRLQKKELSVAVVGNEADPSSAIFRKWTEVVISIGDLREACAYQRPKRRGLLAKAKAPPQPVTSPSSPPQPAPQPAVAAVAPAPAVKPGDAKRPKKSRAKRNRQFTQFDLPAATKLVLEVAVQTPNQALSRAALDRTLQRIPGFTKSDTKTHAAWLGCKSREGLLNTLAANEPRLATFRNPQGGLQLKYVGDLPLVETTSGPGV